MNEFIQSYGSYGLVGWGEQSYTNFLTKIMGLVVRSGLIYKGKTVCKKPW